MSSWREVWEFSQPLTTNPNDDVVTYRVAGRLPVIILDPDTRQRRIVPMQWGFPHPTNPRRPQPIHARCESIDFKPAFRDAFADGQRGIVVMRTFNEGEEVGAKTLQWTVDPLDGKPRGFAFLWRKFDIAGVPAPILACVMATVPASKLVQQITDRMPAILADEDWTIWLGEQPATSDEIKGVLKTVEGVNWEMKPEAKRPKSSKPAEPSSGLF